MSNANRSILATAAVVALAAFLVVGCSGVVTKEIEAERVELHQKPLELSAKDLPDASIDSSGSVKIGSGNLAMTEAQRALTRQYRDAVIGLVDLTLDKTSKVSRHAVARALFGMATGRLEKTEQKIERQAEAIAHAPEFCARLAEVRQSQDRMVQAVATLEPYVDVSRQDVEDCAAGRPYKGQIQAP
jgi:hypothetical protein